MTRCGGCDNRLWCPCCAKEYMTEEESLRETVSHHRRELENSTRELALFLEEKNGPVKVALP